MRAGWRGYRRFLLHTTDGGESWENIPLEPEITRLTLSGYGIRPKFSGNGDRCRGDFTSLKMAVKSWKARGAGRSGGSAQHDPL